MCADGRRVFRNRCKMEEYECEEGRRFDQWMSGECDREDDDDERTREPPPPRPTVTCADAALGCKDTVVRPVCASNGVTYASECVMQQLACKYDLDIRVSKSDCFLTL